MDIDYEKYVIESMEEKDNFFNPTPVKVLVIKGVGYDDKRVFIILPRDPKQIEDIKKFDPSLYGY